MLARRVCLDTSELRLRRSRIARPALLILLRFLGDVVIVVVTIGVPAGMRGDITRWLAELAPGVYVGKVSRRVRESLWSRICDGADPGGALLIAPAANEQGYEVLTHNYKWSVTDLDGVSFLKRPLEGSPPVAPRRNWSKARRRRAASH